MFRVDLLLACLVILAVPGVTALVAPVPDPPVAIAVPDPLDPVCLPEGETPPGTPSVPCIDANLLLCLVTGEGFCFDDMVCDSPGGYGETIYGPAPGVVGGSAGPPNTESPEQGTYGPYYGTGFDPQGC